MSQLGLLIAILMVMVMWIVEAMVIANMMMVETVIGETGGHIYVGCGRGGGAAAATANDDYNILQRCSSKCRVVP